jgi:hypothetical protein
VPGAELERLELGRFQAHRRVPRQQAVVGILAATAHRRLVGVGRRHGPVSAHVARASEYSREPVAPAGAASRVSRRAFCAVSRLLSMLQQ